MKKPLHNSSRLINSSNSNISAPTQHALKAGIIPSSNQKDYQPPAGGAVLAKPPAPILHACWKKAVCRVTVRSQASSNNFRKKIND